LAKHDLPTVSGDFLWEPWGRDFCMKMSTKHCKYVLSFSTSNKPIKPAQAQKKTKHNVTKHWQAPKKKQKA
jgi:hypothetical protein